MTAQSCRSRSSIRADQFNAVISFSGISVLCVGSKMKSVGKFVFVLGLLCYVRSGKLYESSACNQKMATVFAF